MYLCVLIIRHEW